MIAETGKMMRGLPLFTLPDFFLFPGAVAPLHIFEPRYRQMVADLLDTSGRLVLASVNLIDEQSRRGTPQKPLGALGEIVHHETLADGRYLIWVLGLGRVELQEVASDRLYRKTDAQLIADHEPDAEAADRLVPRLLAAIQTRAPRGQLLHGDLSLGLLADILLNVLPLDARRAAAVFGERCPVARAQRALGWHEDC
ncbi:MAG: LON peptidase substrate-binding domain-containing protein [Candidatus Krumholzibacteria bacterium]|jgi:ATP-dependent Lon protease|nr:LON peptidase substrate-binding domain-containing protein [Candidatus Krumholzibacteria bacterium]